MLPVNAGSVKDLISQKQLSTVAIVGFQFGLYHVVVPLSFLRSISLASLFVTCVRNTKKLGVKPCIRFSMHTLYVSCMYPLPY